MDIAPLIDHTLLDPSATRADIRRLCDQALSHGFAAVCVLPSRVHQAAEHMARTPIKVCTVVGFPHGAVPTPVKVAEIRLALEAGAKEIDAVVNLGNVKDGDWEVVSRELCMLRQACPDACLKIIVETSLLDQEEKVHLARLCTQAAVDFVKTSTGTTPGGATVEDVALLAAHVGPGVGIKASGGISTAAQARALMGAGASRLGTSRGVAIAQMP